MIDRYMLIKLDNFVQNPLGVYLNAANKGIVDVRRRRKEPRKLN